MSQVANKMVDVLVMLTSINAMLEVKFNLVSNNAMLVHHVDLAKFLLETHAKTELYVLVINNLILLLTHVKTVQMAN
jgi:hypothetical protein